MLFRDETVIIGETSGAYREKVLFRGLAPEQGFRTFAVVPAPVFFGSRGGIHIAPVGSTAAVIFTLCGLALFLQQNDFFICLPPSAAAWKSASCCLTHCVHPGICTCTSSRSSESFPWTVCPACRPSPGILLQRPSFGAECPPFGQSRVCAEIDASLLFCSL